MGRFELRIPLTEVVVVEEDLRHGLMTITVEGEEYPGWSVGCEAMAMRVDKGSSLAETGGMMMKIEDVKALRSARPNRVIRNPEEVKE
jgi:hypothetical protein